MDGVGVGWGGVGHVNVPLHLRHEVGATLYIYNIYIYIYRKIVTLSCAQDHGAHMRVDCWRACILGHLRANHRRAASYRPTSHNLYILIQSMIVKKLWNTKSLTHSYTHARRFGTRCPIRTNLLKPLMQNNIITSS